MGNERRAVDLRKTQWWRKWERRQMRGKGERKTGVRRGGNKEKGQTDCLLAETELECTTLAYFTKSCQKSPVETLANLTYTSFNFTHLKKKIKLL